MTDPYDLDRFVAAQDAGGTYDRALAELRSGHKTGHWMWFVFPQIAGLGQSPTSRRYAISSLAEARAYLRHPRARPAPGRVPPRSWPRPPAGPPIRSSATSTRPSFAPR